MDRFAPALLVALLLLPLPVLAAAARGSPAHLSNPAVDRVARRAPGIGRVTFVTAARAYLDRGAEDGLAPGQTLELTRRGTRAGTCQIDWVGPHQATCTAGGLRPGDTFPLGEAPQRPEEPKPAELPPLPTAAALRRQREAVAQAEFSPVAFEGAAAAAGLARRIEALLSHQSWIAATPQSAFHRERLEIALRGAEVGGGFELSLDASVVQWTGRPEGFRYPHRSRTQLFVREAELTRRVAGSALAVSAGRIWPWYAANLGTFDGAQFGWRSETGETEAGVFGGTLPDALNLSPSLRPLAGAYASFSGASKDGLLRWWQQQTRVAWVPTSVGRRVELQALARGALAWGFDAGVDARVGMDERFAVALDTLRLDVGARPLDRLELVGGFRYDDRALALLPPGDPTWGVRAIRGDVSASYLLLRHLRVGATAMRVSDLESGLTHTLLGPELGFPRLFAGAASFSLGYLEEAGDSSGRSAFLQSLLRPVDRLQLLARASWYQDTALRRFASSSPQELGLYGSADLRLWSWLWLRGSLLTRVGLEQSAKDQSPPWGLTGTVGAGGTY